MKNATMMAGLSGLLGLSLTSGCTFCLLDGNGPLERSDVATDLPATGASELARLKGETQSLPIRTPSSPVPEEFRGYTLKGGSSFNWDVLFGSARQRVLLQPNDADKRTLLATEDRWGILRPLFWTADFKTLDAETGECLSREKGTTVTSLIVHGSMRKPATSGKAKPEYQSKQKSLNEVKYDTSSGTCIGWGLLAWGQKNSRAYFQIAWIPIPLWSVE